jgi:type IV secretion system protein VirB11
MLLDSSNQPESIDPHKYSTDIHSPPLWVKKHLHEDGGGKGGAFDLWKKLIPLNKYLSDPTVTEICINKPEQIIIERATEWEIFDEPLYTYTELENIAIRVSQWSGQNLCEETPIISATLPTGERVQICAYSAVLPGHISFTLRKPSTLEIPLEDFFAAGYCDNTEWISDVNIQEILESRYLTQIQKDVARALDERRWHDFFSFAIEGKQTILLSGATGTGKTTFMKAMLKRIPSDERLISIENVNELRLYEWYLNSVSLFYSSGDVGVSNVNQRHLLESCMRMYPSRIFLAEIINGDEGFTFLRSIGAGHPGSMTTMHANTAFQARHQLGVLLKQSEAGSKLDMHQIEKMLDSISIILQLNVVKIDNKKKRVMTQVHYDPLAPYNRKEESGDIRELINSAKCLKDTLSELVNVLKSTTPP